MPLRVELSQKYRVELCRARLFKGCIVERPDCLRVLLLKDPIVYRPNCAGTDFAVLDSVRLDCAGLDRTPYRAGANREGGAVQS